MEPSLSTASNDSLLQAYEDIAYVGAPNPNSHPQRLATVATLLGLTVTPPRNARVLELGCGDGANVIPMAALAPDSTFVATDFAPTGLAKAREVTAALGLRNVEFLRLDLRDMPSDLGEFDYVIAHGLYSWVPPDVQRLVLPTMKRHLTPNGIAFVSYNVLPGCHVRMALWQILKYHIRDVPDARGQLAAARSLLSLLADPADTGVESDEALRAEARDALARTDSALFHDDLSAPNYPVYFHEFLRDAEQNGLMFLAESELHSMVGAGITPRVRQALGRMDRLTREQYLDFVHFRRFRQSLLCHAGTQSRFQLQPSLSRTMHVAPTRGLRDMAKSGSFPEFFSGPAKRPLRDLVLERWPRAVPVRELVERFGASATGVDPEPGSPEAPDVVVAQLYTAGLVQLYFDPPPARATGGERPEVFALARLQVREGPFATNLYHEQVRIDTPLVQHIVPMMDGTRTRAEIQAASPLLREQPDAATVLARTLDALANGALLVA